MNAVTLPEFAAYLPQAKAAAGDSVYPCSVAEGYQSGSIFTDGQTVLFWHFCGFAHLSGRPDAAFLQGLLPFFGRPERRFVLITDDDAVRAFFAGKEGCSLAERIYYRAEKAAPVPEMPEGFRLRRMDAALLQRLTGRIIPRFSWDSPERFLSRGTGFCVMHGEEIAASAFSAAVTSDAVDIGVETAEAYRRRGLAKAAAAAVMQEAAALGRTPVWAHHAANIGSMKTAQALGFCEVNRCIAVTKAE